MYDLSILIPAREEMFLSHTVENILQNIRGNTEVIVVLDGYWESVPDAPNVTVLHLEKAIGQRAAQNQAARLSSAKYVMKIDAHCVVDEGFDIKMMEAMRDDYTMVPTMYNLHAFDWLCPEGHRIYQGPTPKGCLQCGKPMTRDIIMQPRWSRRSWFYRFDRTLHFQYWGAFGERPEAQSDVAPTLSIQGSCFMITREKYWEWNICDEDTFNSWGQQGVEVALKTWLNGGQVMVNKKTWYAHMFRTQGGDFTFPYSNPQSKIDENREKSRKMFIDGEWKGKYDLNWLLEKFRPVPDWHFQVQDKIKKTKGVVYYTNGNAPEQILQAVRKQLKKGMKEKHIISVSLQPLEFGQNVVLNEQSGYLTMAKQILAGLEKSTAEVIFLCEHDVLYHPSHFDFIPPREDVIYYNTNVWRVRTEDGHALYVNKLQQLSGLCAYRDVLIKHYRKRVRLLEDFLKKQDDPFYGKSNFSNVEFGQYIRKMGFEPGTHGRPERVDELTADSYQSQYPNLDLRHELNLTPSRWNKDQFRNQKYTDGWTESEEVPGWGIVKNKVPEILASI